VFNRPRDSRTPRRERLAERGTDLMPPDLQFLVARIRVLLRRLREEDDGYTTETIVVTALLVALALAVLATVAVKVKAKANSINP
jgi:hypothetical protein